MIKYQENENNIFALRFMLDRACSRLSEGRQESTRQIKEELAEEFGYACKIYNEAIINNKESDGND